MNKEQQQIAIHLLFSKAKIEKLSELILEINTEFFLEVENYNRLQFELQKEIVFESANQLANQETL